MRIVSVTGLIYHQQVVHRAAIPASFRATKPTHTTLLVRVECDDGLVGWGEGFGHYNMAATARTALQTMVAPRCLGADAGDTTLPERLARVLYASSASGPVAFALSGLDIALWDLRGKKTGQPIHAMLGGAQAQSLAAYASFTRYADPQVVRAEAVEAVRRGYAAIKLHEVHIPEIEAAAAVCQPAGVPLMVDTNCPWTLHEATRMCRRMEGKDHGHAPLDIHWLEEPVWPPESTTALAALRKRTRIRVAAGECAPSVVDFERMVEAGAVDFAQPSVTKLGGITAMVRVMRHAQQRGVAVAPHSPYYGPGLLATLHVCAALVPDTLIEHLFYDFQDGPFGDAVVPRRGRFAVPDGPGLGADPDLARLAAMVTE